MAKLKEIDQAQFEKLCAILCTEEDIAGFFSVSVDTIERWCKRTYKQTFAEVYKKKSATGRVSLRRKQYEVAMGGNVGMLIWLGKQFLGQRDKDKSTNVTIEAPASETVQRAITEIKQLHEEEKCFRQTPQLSLVPQAGLLSRSSDTP